MKKMLEKFKNYQITKSQTVIGGSSGQDFVDSQSINERPATIPVFGGFGGSTFAD